ncbi:MAG: RNA ligase [Candidatus Pacebacteria bacterium]|nr:RNA ligase [Candidatus Paceibacterota bacterium]
MLIFWRSIGRKRFFPVIFINGRRLLSVKRQTSIFRPEVGGGCALRERIALLFELTAPDNLVVLPYSETRLTLIKAREEETGRFISLSDLEPLTTEFGIDVVEEIQIANLSDLIDLAKAKEMFEGWVVQFSDGQLMKLKTTWYAGIHNM